MRIRGNIVAQQEEECRQGYTLNDIEPWIQVDVGIGKADGQKGNNRIGWNDKTDAHDPVEKD